MLSVTAFRTAILISSLCATVGAQSPAAAAARDSRGVTFGVAGGVAVPYLQTLPTLTTESNADVALGWRIGYRLSPRVAVVLNGVSAVYTYTGTGRVRKRGFEGIYPSVQYWVQPALWVSAGVGVALDAPAFYDIHGSNAGERSFHSGVGAVGIVGYRFARVGRFGVESQLRVHTGSTTLPQGNRHGTAISALIGISR